MISNFKNIIFIFFNLYFAFYFAQKKVVDPVLEIYGKDGITRYYKGGILVKIDSNNLNKNKNEKEKLNTRTKEMESYVDNIIDFAPNEKKDSLQMLSLAEKGYDNLTQEEIDWLKEFNKKKVRETKRIRRKNIQR